MVLSRRTVLRAGCVALAAGVAGCAGTGGTAPGRSPTATATSGSTDSAPRTRTATPSPSSTATDQQLLYRVAVAATDGEPFDVTATMLEPQVTTAHTATVQVTFSNRTDSEATVHGVEPDEGGQLHPHVERDGAWEAVTGPKLIGWHVDPSHRRSRTCWKPTGPIPSLTPGSYTLAPGEWFSNEFELWQAADAEGCLHPGSYVYGDVGRETDSSWRVDLDIKPP